MCVCVLKSITTCAHILYYMPIRTCACVWAHELDLRGALPNDSPFCVIESWIRLLTDLSATAEVCTHVAEQAQAPPSSPLDP